MKSRVTYNVEAVEAYDWGKIYQLYMKGYTVPYLMDNVIPKSLGLRHRYQVFRILAKRYGDIRRKTNTCLSSLIKDYPEYGLELLDSARDLRSDTRYYSQQKLANKSKYNSATYCKGVDASYGHDYHNSLTFANEPSDKWRYHKDGLSLPILVMFSTCIMAVLSQVLTAYMYNQITGAIAPVLNYDPELAENTGIGTR